MKKFILFLIFVQISIVDFGQIIADHTVVAQYDKIPQQYIDAVKKMWLSYAGESHSMGIRNGLLALEAAYPAYAVSVVEGGTPEAYTTTNLRASRATWGDVDYSTGWIYSYGEEDWYTSSTAMSRTKASITYCNTHSLTLAAFGFGWCWDPAETDMTNYLNATQQYIDYCTTNGYSTKVFFTTGPVDDVNASGQTGYLKSLAYETIRNYAKANSSRILFDYADILCYDDNGATNTATWDGHTYPIITTTNLTPTVADFHISNAGALRLAKAIWWMLARMAGWDGIVTGVEENKSLVEMKIVADNNSDEIRISSIDAAYLSGQISLYNLNGILIEKKAITDNSCTLNKSSLSPGVYFITVNKSNLKETRKIIVVK
jgi:hypothetical protein